MRFVVFDEDYFGEPNFLGQGTFPLQSLRSGYRSVQLKNSHGEDLELACLLVQIEISIQKVRGINCVPSMQVSLIYLLSFC